MGIDRKYIIGFFTYSGLFVPYFAQSFSLFGLHNRVFGNILLLLSMLLCIQYVKWNQKSVNILLLFIIFYILTLVIYSSPSQINNLVSLSFEKLHYYDDKLAGIIFVSTMPIFTAYVVSGITNDESFKRGFVHAMAFLSVVAILVSINSSEYWVLAGNNELKGQKQDLEVFSTISMTILHLSGLFFSLAYILKRKYIFVNFLIFLGSAVFIVLYRQRSAWVYIPVVMIGLFFILSERNFLKMINNTLLLVLLLISGVVLVVYSGVITDTVMAYWSELTTGEGVYTRIPLFSYAWNGFLDYPYGHGLAAFSIDNPMNVNYPHNIILEALYELGAIGGIFIMVLLYFSFKAIRNLLLKLPKRIDNKALSSLVISAVFGYLLFVSLKSGDLISIEVFLAMTIMFSARQSGKRKRRVEVV